MTCPQRRRAAFGALHEVGFDGIVTSCVSAWEESAVESSRFIRQEIQRYVDKCWGTPG